MKGVCKSNVPVKHVIGVLGSAHGMGVTHFTISLANYIRERWGRTVAVVEYNDHASFEQMAQHKIWQPAQSIDDEFQIMDVTYFPAVDRERLIQIQNRGFDYYLMDFGCAYTPFPQEFLRCDKKIVMGSLSEWRKAELEQFLETVKNIQGIENWDILAIFGLKEDKKEFKRKSKINIKTVPYIENPFQITRENFMFLEQFV